MNDECKVIKYDESFFDGWEKNSADSDKWSHVKSVLVCGNPNREIPLVSVCIPTYKGRAKYLKEAINSILNQENFDSYEIIVSDNYSPGDAETEKLMNEFCEKHSNIYYYRTDYDFGMIANWNRAVELGRAKWTVLLHNDDVMHSDYLYKTYKVAKETNASLIGVFRDMIQEGDGINGNYIKNLSKSQLILKKLRRGKYFHVKPDDVIRFITPATGCLWYDREKFLQYGLHDDKFEETADGFSHFKETYNGNVIIIPDFLYSRRISNVNSFGKSSTQAKIISLLYQFGKYYIKNNLKAKNSPLASFTLDVSAAYLVYGIKSKYAPGMDVAGILGELGVRKSIANMHPKLLTLLNCVLLTDLIFRK